MVVLTGVDEGAQLAGLGRGEVASATDHDEVVTVVAGADDGGGGVGRADDGADDDLDSFSVFDLRPLGGLPLACRGTNVNGQHL